MYFGITLTQIYYDKADTRWENEKESLSECLLNPTWQMPNLKDGAQKIKRERLVHKYFSKLSKSKGVMELLFFLLSDVHIEIWEKKRKRNLKSALVLFSFKCN